MSEYYFKDKEFFIENYDKQKTFSSFLPGLAGKRGIPLWAFYVNRGQGIASFGLENKDSQILQFKPAVKSYQEVGIEGFRTFVKVDGNVYEIFGENQMNVKRTMKIQRAEFTIEEVNEELGLQFTVTYFGLPNENIAALVRQVEVKNIGGELIEFELLDGISQLLPYKVENMAFNAISNLLRSWMEVYSLEHNIGFYRMRSSSGDSAEVTEIVRGNFYISTFENEQVRPIVDWSLVFGYDTSKRFARNFEEKSIDEINASEQVTANKIPVGFTGVKVSLEVGEVKHLNTVIGHAHSEEQALKLVDTLKDKNYLDQKRFEASDEINQLLKDVEVETAFPIFDDYIKQNYLDNMLRGGYPMVLHGDDQDFVYHLFSRRHGDLERDYNYFSLAPEFYSQGNGNFRDVCQNRRSDVLFVPEVKDFNMKMFASFIQIDGFNPLAINGSTFMIHDKRKVERLVKEVFHSSPVMHGLLNGKFTPGSVINTLANNNIEVQYNDEELFDIVFEDAVQVYEASFGEGYWIDHWTYILDLVENFEAVYPDKMYDALFNDLTYSYYDSPVYVLPRDEKTCLTKDGKIRRFGSVIHHDHEKIQRCQMNEHGTNWLKDEDGREVKASLYSKLFTLVVNKVASLDPSGMGIEMEANKPGWNDAMNGLPGLFGSGVSETIEIKRVIQFLLDHYSSNEELELPYELVEFVEGLLPVIKHEFDDYVYWDKATTLKENFRDKVHYGVVGTGVLDSKVLYEFLEEANKKIELSLSKALRFGDGVYPTYLVHEVAEYEELYTDNGPKIGNYNLPTVKAKKFSVRKLPNYLEAPARALKIMKNEKNIKTMYQSIKVSNVYDHQLKFYKTSEFLDNESNEIGRGRSFTKGWQERESNFLHMTYKYILGLLKAGLYEEFYEEIKTNLTCFMDPAVYGRSTLENSSFIASSVNPDPSVRGQGWVARLSGSTAEMLSIYTMMLFGKKPFVMDKGELVLNLHPYLSKEFFKDSVVTFRLLGKVHVTYVNESNIDTFNDAFHIRYYEVDGKKVESVRGQLAQDVRSGKVSTIKVYF